MRIGQNAKGFLGATGLDDFVAFASQNELERAADVLLVVDHQHARRGRNGVRRLGSCGVHCRRQAQLLYRASRSISRRKFLALLEKGLDWYWATTSENVRRASSARCIFK